MTGIEKKVTRTITIEAVITRADGTVENLGTIYSESFFQRALRSLKKLVRGAR
jgi:hypothetical protein